MLAQAAWRSFGAGLAAVLLAPGATACSDAEDVGAPEAVSRPCSDDSQWECLAWTAGAGVNIALVSASRQPVTVQISRGERFVDATVLEPGAMEKLVSPGLLEPAADSAWEEYRLRSDGPISLQSVVAE